MGQHKHNPVAIAAKAGKLPPRPPRPSKAEVERKIMDALREMTVAAMMEKRAGAIMDRYIEKTIKGGAGRA